MYNLSWDKFVELVKDTYCPQHEVEKVETDFLTLVMKDLDCRSYVTSFNSMSRLVPYLVTPEPKRIARFIGGLAPEIKGNVKASKPTSYRSVVDLSLSLTLDVIRSKSKKTTEDGKRKREDGQSHQSNKKKKGNSSQEGEKGHIKTNCPKNTKKPDEAKKTNARVFQMNAREAVNDDKVITGADKSFVDHKFSKLLNLPIKTLDIKYEVELADGILETASTLLDGCFISIKNHSIPLSLLPMKLAGFDVVLGMD
ncbi:uncharacterized protein LOC110907628 [Helianthus annuus]|uniref:uncharacterized protein LOC110907628 n=1 Tax=Helianthus annuus TaxID=4232 RepID=UPI000B903E31|nr:uncharacterized protein LOC110907628 [Helianthus annuus]